MGGRAAGTCREAADEGHDTIRAHGWRPYTEQSIQDSDALDRVLDEVAARGYALDGGERGLAVKCAAAPVRGRTGAVVAAIGVSGRPDHLDEIGLGRIREAVRERADAVSSRLGHLASWRW